MHLYMHNKKHKDISMIINTAIRKAKAQEEEKVAISLKVSANTKAKLQKIADQNSVSLNNLCTSILDSALEGDLDSQGTLKLVEILDEAKKDFDTCNEMIDSGEYIIESSNGSTIDFRISQQIASAKIAAISAELNRRGKE